MNNDAVKRAEALVNKLDSDYRRTLRDIDYNRKRSQEFLAKADEAEKTAEKISVEIDKAKKYYEALSNYADLQNQILSEVSRMEEQLGLAPQEEVKELPKADISVNKAPVEELSLDESKEEVKEEVKEEEKEEVQPDSISEFVPAGDLVKEDEKVIKDDQGNEMHIIENPGTKYASKGFIIVDIPKEVKADNDNYAKKSKATIAAKEKLSLLWNKVVNQVAEMSHEEEAKEVKGVEDANTGLKDILPMTELMQPIDIKTITK